MTHFPQQSDPNDTVFVTAPVRGLVLDLSDVPDPGFASLKLGPGFAIEPLEEQFVAPISGVISSVASASHALSIRDETGIEILVHVGIDTVSLGGRGFKLLVNEGDKVKAGEPIIEVDLTQLARSAKSLASPIVLLNPSHFETTQISKAELCGAGDKILAIRSRGGDFTAEPNLEELLPSPEDLVWSEPIAIRMHAGIHARPAAQISRLAQMIEHPIFIERNGKLANAKSVSQLIALSVAFGDKIRIAIGTGEDEAIISAMAELIRAGAGDEIAAHSETNASPIEPDLSLTGRASFQGVFVSSGIAIGRTAHFKNQTLEIPKYGADPNLEIDALGQAISSIHSRILTESMKRSGEASEILLAHTAILDDPDLLMRARRAIETGVSAGAGWKQAIDFYVRNLSGSEEIRTKERVSDYLDLEQQVLLELYGNGAKKLGIQSGDIVVADDLTPSQYFELEELGVAGICLAKGGATSHVSLLAAGSGLPTAISLGPRILDTIEGRTMLLDSENNLVVFAPSVNEVSTYQSRRLARAELLSLAKASAGKKANLSNGSRVHVMANLASLEDATAALEQGADGSGLLRTEFLFAGQSQAPGEKAQLNAYNDIAAALNGARITLRTLDAGGDKPIAFLKGAIEENPALGLRGIRTHFKHEDLMRTQFRAILRAAEHHPIEVMVPMITNAAEMNRVRNVFGEEASKLGIKCPPIGAMIETPASALLVDQILELSDFLSIGSNDLAQYVLAMDRTNPELAPDLDAMSPAVLRVVKGVALEAKRVGKDVSVCGGLASDPVGVPALIGCGIRKLSCAPSTVAIIKHILRGLDVERCETLVEDLLSMQTSADARSLVTARFPELEVWR